MAEFEELRLTITLVDNATAGIKAMRVELRAVEADAHRFRQKMQELVRDHKDFSTNLNRVNAQTALLAAAAGYAGSKLDELKTKVYEQVTVLDRFAKEMQQISNAAKLLGLSFGHLRSIIEQGEKYGLDENTMKRIAGAMLGLQAQLKTRLGIDRFRAEMFSQFKLDPQDLEAYIDRLRTATNISEFLRALQETGDLVYERTKGDEGLKQKARQEWLIEQGMPAHLALLKKLDEPTLEYLAQQDSILQATERWNTELSKIQENLDSIKDTFALQAMSIDGNFYKGLVLGFELTTQIADNLKRWLVNIKAIPGWFLKLFSDLAANPGAGQMPPELFKPRKQSFTSNDQFEELYEEIKKVNELLRPTGPRIVPAAYTPGGGVAPGGGGGTAGTAGGGGGGLFGGAGAFRGLLGGGQGGTQAAPGGRVAALPPSGGPGGAPPGGGPPGGGPPAQPPAPPPGVPAPGVPSAPAPVVPGGGTGGAPFSPGRMRLPGAPYSPGRMPTPGGGGGGGGGPGTGGGGPAGVPGTGTPGTPGGGTGGYTPRPGETPVPGGAGGGSDALTADRARFAEELRNPAVQERLYRLTAAENPQDPHAFMESVMNRASARGHSLTQEMNDPSYFPGVSLTGKDPGSNRGAFQSAQGDVLAGSNRTNLSTGNYSYSARRGWGGEAVGQTSGGLGGGTVTYKTGSGRQTEYYGVENMPRDIAWNQRMQRQMAGENVRTAFPEGGFTPIPKPGGYNRADISMLRQQLDRGLTPGTPPTAGAAPIDTSKLRPGANVQELQSKVAATRRQPIDPQLRAALDYAAEKNGLQVRVTSGGQPLIGTGGARTGSRRHDLGRAADFDLVDSEGKKLERDDPRRLQFIEDASAAGAGGGGFGYMSDPYKLHMGTTGSQGIVGKGLGAYAGSKAEREAMARGVEASSKFDRSLLEGRDTSRVTVNDADRQQAYNRLLGGHKDEFKEGGFTPVPQRGGFTPVDRSFLDQQMGNKIQLPKVEGTGKVSIKVTEPKDVGSAPANLFRKDTVETQTTMQPANDGPKVEVTGGGGSEEPAVEVD